MVSVSSLASSENRSGSAQWASSSASESDDVVPSVEADEGWGIIGKLFLFGVIVAAVLFYLRISKRSLSRNGGILGEEKSLA